MMDISNSMFAFDRTAGHHGQHPQPETALSQRGPVPVDGSAGVGAVAGRTFRLEVCSTSGPYDLVVRPGLLFRVLCDPALYRPRIQICRSLGFRTLCFEPEKGP